MVQLLSILPQDVIQWVRCWDLAATEKTEKGDPAYTAGVLIGKRKNGRYIVADVINKQMSASDICRRTPAKLGKSKLGPTLNSCLDST